MPLLQRLECDLGDSAFADDVVVGRSEEEFFEALEHSDIVLDEELEAAGSEIGTREVVLAM